MRGQRALGVLIAAVAWLGGTAAAHAETFKVTTTADINDGACTAAKCSLRDAVAASNAATAGPNQIVLGVVGDYGLTTGQSLIVSQDVTVTGKSAAKTSIDGRGLTTIFNLQDGNLTLRDLTLADGAAKNSSPQGPTGGAIYDDAAGSITISNCHVLNNHATGSGGGGGGAIFDAFGGTITLSNDSFRDNSAGGPSASDSGDGGAIETTQSVAATHVTMSDNHAGGHGASGEGGAITDQGSGVTVTASGSTFSDNTAGGKGGYGRGGAIDSEVPISLTRSSLDGNLAGGGSPNGYGYGGAIEVGAVGTLTLTGSSVTRNVAGGGGAGAFGDGGGVDVQSSDVAVLNSTISDNHAGAFEGVGTGGGLSVNGSLSLRYSTVAGNSATGGAGGGIQSSSLKALASIVADNTASAEPNCDGPATSPKYDIENGTSCGFTGTGDLNANPELTPVANNGGGLLTQRPQPTSPAVNHVPRSAGCPATDERGVARPQGTRCDVGAYELAPPTGAKTGAVKKRGARQVKVSGSASNPDLEGGHGYIEYGTTTHYGSKSASQKLPAGAKSLLLNFTLSNLKPHTTYHYRFVAVSPDGTTYGPSKSFGTK